MKEKIIKLLSENVPVYICENFSDTEIVIYAVEKIEGDKIYNINKQYISIKCDSDVCCMGINKQYTTTHISDFKLIRTGEMMIIPRSFIIFDAVEDNLCNLLRYIVKKDVVSYNDICNYLIKLSEKHQMFKYN